MAKKFTQLPAAQNLTSSDIIAVVNGGESKKATLDQVGTFVADSLTYVSDVIGSAPITSSGGATPTISISAATNLAAGSMSAADKTKLDGITAGASVASVGGTAPITSTGGTAPTIGINAATTLAAGSMSAADKLKLDGIAAGASIAGTIAANEIAFGTGVDSIGGSANLTYDGTKVVVTGIGDCLEVADATDGVFLKTDTSFAALVWSDPLSGNEAINASAYNGVLTFGVPLQLNIADGLGGNKMLSLRDDGAGAPEIQSLETPDGVTFAAAPLRLSIAELQLNGAPGNSGDVIVSGGAGVAPTWQIPTFGNFGSKVLLCVQGGSYATIQAAIDAASDWDVILVGPKAAGASWGPMTFSPGKRLVVASLGSKWSTQVRVDSITFNADSGLNILENTVFVRGLFINSSFTALAPGVNFYGSAPARLRLQECFIYNSNAATGTGVVSNNSGSGSSLYIDNCIVQSGASTGIGVDHQQGYTIIRGDSEISRYQYQVQCARPGLPVSNVEITNTLLDGTGAANEVIRITGGTVTCGYSTIKNATTNASGVNLTAAGAAFGAGDATFAIATGTGYCVRGVVNSVYLYGNVTYSNSTAAAYNTKVQTGSPANPAAFLAAIPVAQAFTNSA